MYEILIEDIPEEGLVVEASEADPWLREVVDDALGEAFASGDRARAKLSIDRVGSNLNVVGTIEISSHPSCDRCLRRYEFREDVPLHAVLAPLYENRRQQKLGEDDDVELVMEDLDFQFYEGDRFDLAEVIREEIVLDEPMKHLCREDCKGLCQRCGKDLNEGPCGCPKEGDRSAFTPLRDVRINTDTKH